MKSSAQELVTLLLLATSTSCSPALLERQDAEIIAAPTVTEAPDALTAGRVLPTSVVTTTAFDDGGPADDDWTPDRPDPYVCEYLGQNDCWRPSYPQGGPPYMGPSDWPERNKTCVVVAGNDPDGDDAPAIIQAFDDCKSDGHIIFENTTYYVGTVMNTTGLKNVDVEVKGTLLWSDDVQYWLGASLPIGYQNQTSAWFFGGESVHFYGHGYGTLDGNGQVWYDFNEGIANLNGRPHAITIDTTTNSVIEGLRFVQSQMWTMTIARSERILLQDIYVNSTSEPRPFRADINTDGCDTIYVNDITFLRWIVQCGDDSISMKQNSTNVYIADTEFYSGLAFAMGSIGQYPGQIAVIENVTATNITCSGTRHAGRVKSFGGIDQGDPPNSGGGGIGIVRNITWTDFVLNEVENPWHISQCLSFRGEQVNGCSSLLQVEDLKWGRATGTVTTSAVADLQCSGNTPCRGVNIFDTEVTFANGTRVEEYLCENVQDPIGFECTGPA